MPFRKWSVEPVFLSRKPLPPDKKCYGSEFVAVTNGTLVQCLMQLSSVAKIADRIFDEISSEFRLVAERAERLKVKVEVCQDIVSKLNARAVKVPVSDLCETSRFLRRQKSYTPPQELQTQFFMPSNRPPVIDELYQKASATPVTLICSMDRYRMDGLTSSQVFMVTPVLGGGGGRKRGRKHLDIETRKPANFSLARDQQDEDMYDLSSYSALVSPSIGGNLRQNASRELERLPSPEEQALCTSLEYPSMVVPVDTRESTFNRMSLFRRSLLHVDFVIKRKKDKRKSKRRHTVCEGDSREIEKAIRDISVAHSSCQTDDMFDIISSTSTTIHRSLSKRRSRSTMDNSRRKSSDIELDLLKQDCKDSNENIKDQSKKSKLATIKSRACNFNPLSSISAAITMAAVKMRQSTRTGKHDDGRSSSGNWSASSSTRASVDSDHQHATTPIHEVSSPSRNSVGKDSLLSDITHQDQHNRSRDDIPVQTISKSPTKQKKYTPVNPPWAFDPGSSHIPNQELTALHTPTIRSPYAGRKGAIDDGDSSVYSVDTDGYYTSMHTDSGLWTLDNLPKPDELNGDGYRLRQESQSSVSTIGNSSINSFLSNKSATECSSSENSLKRRSVIPQPPPRVSSCNQIKDENVDKQGEGSASEQSDSPQPHNGSESDFDVGDRIRVKTAITPFRYPSMCAVSPETSDDEIGDWKNSNVVVAEVHREEDIKVRHDSLQLSKVPITDNQRLSNQGINMYRSETPVQSCFSSKIQHNQVTTSTPRSGIAISTFSPDLQDFSDTSTNKTGSSEDLKSIDDGLIVTENLVSPLAIGSVPDKSLIPLKYAQHITVTPIARSSASAKYELNTSRCSSEMSNSSIERQSPRKTNSISSSSYVSYKSPDSPISHIIKPYNSVPSSPTGSLSRPVARVTLDPSGKVVFSSNSLERTGNTRQNTKITQEKGYSTLPAYQSPVMENGFMSSSQIPVPKTPSSSTNTQNEVIPNRYSDLKTDSKSTPVTVPTSPAAEHSIMNTKAIPSALSTFATNSVLNRTVATSANNPILSSSPTNSATSHNPISLPFPTSSRDFNFRPSRGGRLCRSYFPSHLISPSNTGDQCPSNNPERTFTPSNILYRPKQYSPAPMHASPQVPSGYKNSSLSQRFNSPSAVPNKAYSSSIPLYQGKLNDNCNSAHPPAVRADHPKIENVYSHKNASSNTNSYFNTPNPKSLMSKPPDLIPSGASPPSTLDITSNQNKRTSMDGELKLMSATELFAIIHNSKKKHNIKTESEKSMSPMSSRSASPALSQCSLPSKLQPIETGVLSKRNVKPCDRTNWYNSMPSRRPLKANDKITNVKPTSMRDFKMLLLQTRTGGSDNSPRPSAAELLKVSPPKTPGLQSPTSRTILTPSPVKTPTSYINQNSFSPSLVVVKRNRARSPFLARYDNAYPPIMEDCSEELESSHQENKCLGSQAAEAQLYQEHKPSVSGSGPAAKATSTWV